MDELYFWFFALGTLFGGAIGELYLWWEKGKWEKVKNGIINSYHQQQGLQQQHIQKLQHNISVQSQPTTQQILQVQQLPSQNPLPIPQSQPINITIGKMGDDTTTTTTNKTKNTDIKDSVVMEK